MNVETVDLLIEKDPSLESSRSSLEAMKEGAVCIHRAWGVGRISGFESDRGMILVDFEEGERKSHAMDPVFCLDKLEVLNEDHIISRHRSNSSEVEELVKKEPVNLVVEILSKCEEGCATTRELERTIFSVTRSDKGEKMVEYYKEAFD